MAGVQLSELAIAVCNAGGLGSLPGAMLGPSQLESQLSAMRTGTARPYNVNFFCHRTPVPDPAREAAWRALLLPFYREFGLDPATAEETYKVVLQTLSEDGTVSADALEDLMQQVKKETGVTRDISATDIVDYRMLREVATLARANNAEVLEYRDRTCTHPGCTRPTSTTSTG